MHVAQQMNIKPFRDTKEYLSLRTWQGRTLIQLATVLPRCPYSCKVWHCSLLKVLPYNLYILLPLFSWTVLWGSSSCPYPGSLLVCRVVESIATHKPMWIWSRHIWQSCLKLHFFMLGIMAKFML